MKYTIYIVENESDVIWVEDKFGQDAGHCCRSGVSVNGYKYGDIGVRTLDGRFLGYGTISFYKTDKDFKNSEFVRISEPDSTKFDAESYDFLGLMG